MTAAHAIAAHRDAVLDTAEALGVGVAFVNRAGAPLACNPAFAALCSDDDSRARIAEHVRSRFAALESGDLCVETVPLATMRVAAARVLPDQDLAVVQVRAEPVREVPDTLDGIGLTPAQKRVARGLAAGLANRAIARRLGVTEHTARRHTEQIFAKLGVRSRAAAAVRLMGNT